MSPHEVPFVRLLVPFASGIALGASVEAWREWGWPILIAGTIGLIGWALRKHAFSYRWAYGAALSLWLLAAGCGHMVLRDERRWPNHFARCCPEATAFVGVVCDVPDGGRRVKVPIRVEAAAEQPGDWRSASGYLLLLAEPTDKAASLRYGDRIWVSARAAPVEPPQNPHAFDYRRYLHHQNVHYRVFVNDGAFGHIDGGHGQPIWRLAYAWRERLLVVLRDYFPTQDEYAIAAALLLGYKEELSEELRTTYVQTGSMHALAVSGTHVGLLYAALYFLVRRIPWRGGWQRWGEMILLIGGIWTFALITGASPSVLRASLMFSLFLVGKALMRHASTWNALGATGFILLLANPHHLFDVGFQLSFAAVVGIVGLRPLLLRYSPALPKWLRAPWEVFLVGVSAQLGTLPLALYYFHQFPVYFWLAGWVVVLGGALYLWGVGLLLVLHAVSPAAAEVIGQGLYYGLWGMNGAMRAIQHLPGSVVENIWISTGAALCICVCIVFGAAGLYYRRPRWLLLALSALLLVFMERLVRRTTQIQQRQVVLYAVGRHLLIDFFAGTQLYTWADSLPERYERFAAEVNRSAAGVVGPPHRIHPCFDQPFRSAHLLVQPPFVQFFDKRLAVVEHAHQLGNSASMPLSVDALVLHDNPRVTVEECLRHFQPRLIVISAANSVSRARRWEVESKQRGLPVHYVRIQGAWRLDAR